MNKFKMNRIVILICAALILAQTIWVAYLWSNKYETEAINRGYALYCPSTGNFAWKGECDGNLDQTRTGTGDRLLEDRIMPFEEYMARLRARENGEREPDRKVWPRSSRKVWELYVEESNDE